MSRLLREQRLCGLSGAGRRLWNRRVPIGLMPALLTRSQRDRAGAEGPGCPTGWSLQRGGWGTGFPLWEVCFRCPGGLCSCQAGNAARRRRQARRESGSRSPPTAASSSASLGKEPASFPTRFRGALSSRRCRSRARGSPPSGRLRTPRPAPPCPRAQSGGDRGGRHRLGALSKDSAVCEEQQAGKQAAGTEEGPGPCGGRWGTGHRRLGGEKSPRVSGTARLVPGFVATPPEDHCLNRDSGCVAPGAAGPPPKCEALAGSLARGVHRPCPSDPKPEVGIWRVDVQKSTEAQPLPASGQRDAVTL